MKSFFTKKGGKSLSSLFFILGIAFSTMYLSSCSSFPETLTVNLVNNYEGESVCFVVSFMDSSSYLIEEIAPSSKDNYFDIESYKTEYETYDISAWAFTKSTFEAVIEEGKELYGTDDQDVIFSNFFRNYDDLKDFDFAEDSRSFEVSGSDGFNGSARIVFSRTATTSQGKVRILAED